jgi:hypothetical protein
VWPAALDFVMAFWHSQKPEWGHDSYEEDVAAFALLTKLSEDRLWDMFVYEYPFSTTGIIHL